MRSVAVTMMAFALLSGAALAADTIDATVEFSGGQVAAGIGYTWGHGEIVYQGQKHRFSVSGISIVDVGVTDYTASGVVYNLKNLDDVNGNYSEATAGMTIAGGGSGTYLKNEHGVVMKLVESSRGLRFNLAAGGVKIKLQN